MLMIHLVQTVYPACQANNFTSNAKDGDLLPVIRAPPEFSATPASPGLVLTGSIYFIRHIEYPNVLVQHMLNVVPIGAHMWLLEPQKWGDTMMQSQ